MLEMRKLAGMKTSKNHINYVNKYMRACFNQKPPSKRSQKIIWDVNILLQFFDKCRENKDLSCNELGGKAILLTMLTTMCRKADVSQLKLSNVVKTKKGDLRFHLEEPTKTYNDRTFKNQTGLQTLIIPQVPQNPKLCPVEALESYLEKVEFVRGNLDEVFILLKDPSSPAKSQTLARWCNDILREAGIENHSTHSVRSASTCGALIRGVPLDKIIQQAGWSQVSSFIRNYLKPLTSSHTGQECPEFHGKANFSRFPHKRPQSKVVQSANLHTRCLQSGKQTSAYQASTKTPQIKHQESISSGNSHHINLQINEHRRMPQEIVEISNNQIQADMKDQKLCSPQTKAKIREKIMNRKATNTVAKNNTQKSKNSLNRKRKGKLLDAKLVQVWENCAGRSVVRDPFIQAKPMVKCYKKLKGKCNSFRQIEGKYSSNSLEMCTSAAVAQARPQDRLNSPNKLETIHTKVPTVPQFSKGKARRPYPVTVSNKAERQPDLPPGPQPQQQPCPQQEQAAHITPDPRVTTCPSDLYQLNSAVKLPVKQKNASGHMRISQMHSEERSTAPAKNIMKNVSKSEEIIGCINSGRKNSDRNGNTKTTVKKKHISEHTGKNSKPISKPTPEISGENGQLLGSDDEVDLDSVSVITDNISQDFEHQISHTIKQRDLDDIVQIP